MPTTSDPTVLNVPGLPEPMGYYAPASRAGDLLFISGLLPLDAKGNLVGDDVITQAGQVFASMGLVLEAAGVDFSAVVKLTTFLTDIRDRAALNAVSLRVFGDHKPASTLVGISNLAVAGALIEIDAVALLPSA